MIAFVLRGEDCNRHAVAACVTGLRATHPRCRIAIFDAAEAPMRERPDCDFYRVRQRIIPGSRQWHAEDGLRAEIGMLAAAARAFPAAHQIARITDTGIPAAPPSNAHDFYCWPGGFILRSSLVPRVLPNVATGNADCIHHAIANIVASLGGSTGSHPMGGEGDHYWTRPAFSRIPMRARAFATVATGGMAAEAEILVRTLRRHHAEPLVLVCDAPVAGRIRALGLPAIEIEPITEALRRHAAKISANVVSHGNYWNPEAIALKFHAARAAIDRHGPAHLLDADIAVNASLHTGGPWAADLVLSPHFEANPHAPWIARFGTYNAGYLMARDSRVVDRWEALYREGIGGFYEQACLDQLSREFASAMFNPDHNFGRWRPDDPARRNIVSYHHKTSLGRQTPKIGNLTDATQAALAACAAPRKIAAVDWEPPHGPPGPLRQLAIETLAPQFGFQLLSPRDLNLGREWTKHELGLIAEDVLWGQHRGGCHFVHSHGSAWSAATADAFRKHGWITIAVPPRTKSFKSPAWLKHIDHVIRDPGTVPERLGFPQPNPA